MFIEGADVSFMHVLPCFFFFFLEGQALHSVRDFGIEKGGGGGGDWRGGASISCRVQIRTTAVAPIPVFDALLVTVRYGLQADATWIGVLGEETGSSPSVLYNGQQEVTSGDGAEFSKTTTVWWRGMMRVSHCTTVDTGW